LLGCRFEEPNQCCANAVPAARLDYMDGDARPDERLATHGTCGCRRSDHAATIIAHRNSNKSDIGQLR
jgi:hypothetical protein